MISGLQFGSLEKSCTASRIATNQKSKLNFMKGRIAALLEEMVARQHVWIRSLYGSLTKPKRQDLSVSPLQWQGHSRKTQLWEILKEKSTNQFTDMRTACGFLHVSKMRSSLSILFNNCVSQRVSLIVNIFYAVSCCLLPSSCETQSCDHDVWHQILLSTFRLSCQNNVFKW